MPYLILDPCDEYTAEMMQFLGRADLGAVAVFSTMKRFDEWRFLWANRLGHLVHEAFLAPLAGGDARRLAARIHHGWPELHGIIPWDERHVMLGAELAELLELDWNSTEIIERCRDKGTMKAWLAERAPVRINASARVEDGREALAFQEAVGRWPIVVKPTGGAGSFNVFFADSQADLLRYCQRVFESGRGEVLLEEYVGGEELAVNGIADANGDLLVTDVWLYDRRTVDGVPNLYYQVSKVSSDEPIFGVLGNYAAAIVDTLEVSRSPIHMEVKVDDRGPCLIEVGARLPGGNLPTLASKLHGRSLFELAACHYVGYLPGTQRDLDFRRYDSLHAMVVSGIQPVDLPRISAVHGSDEVSSLPSFDSFGLVRRVGRPAPRTVDLDTQAWELYLIHRDGDQIAADAAKAHQLLRYE